VAQRKTSSSPFQSLQAPISYDKTDAELEASMKADVDKWMAGIKKAPPPKKSAAELEAECRMLRCLSQQKKLMHSDYKCTVQNLYCAKRSDEILQN
jgi:hypothetical protein